MVRRHPGTWRRKPRHTPRTFASAAPHPTRNSSNHGRKHLALQPVFRGRNTSSPVWTKLVNVARTAPSCGCASFFKPAREGQRTVEEEETLQLVHNVLAYVKICRSSEILSINLLVSQISGASALLLDRLALDKSQVPVGSVGERGPAQSKRCASSPPASEMRLGASGL